LILISFFINIGLILVNLGEENVKQSFKKMLKFHIYQKSVK